MRKNTLVEYAKSIDLKLEIENEYGLRKFIEAVYPNWDNRCARLHTLRFGKPRATPPSIALRPVYLYPVCQPVPESKLMRQICEQMAENTVSVSARDFSPRFLARTRIRRMSLACTCRITAVFSRGGPLPQAQKEEKPDAAPEGVRRKSVFRHNSTEIPAITAPTTHEDLVYYIMYSRP